MKFNIKRLMALFATGFFITTSGYSETSRNQIDCQLEETIVVNQKDDMFKNSSLLYKNRKFYYSGCGPSSIANSIILAFDYEGDIDNLIRETLYLFCYNHKPKNETIRVKNLSLLDNNNSFLDDNSDDYPLYNELINNYDGKIIYTNEIDIHYLNKLDDNIMLLDYGSFDLDSLLDKAWLLYENGYYDTEIIINCLSAGSKNGDGPFRTENGHYFCLYLNVSSFIEDGSFYIIDSLPRALFNENGYNKQYDFCNDKYQNKFKEFNKYFSCERINQGVIKINTSDMCSDLSNNKKSWKEFMKKRMKYLYLGGTVGIIINIQNTKLKRK